MKVEFAAAAIAADDVEIGIWRASECFPSTGALAAGRAAYTEAIAVVRSASRTAASAARSGVEDVAGDVCEAVAEGGAT